MGWILKSTTLNCILYVMHQHIYDTGKVVNMLVFDFYVSSKYVLITNVTDTWCNESYKLIIPTEHCVMALYSIVILALIAKLSQSFCYLDKGFTRLKEINGNDSKLWLEKEVVSTAHVKMIFSQKIINLPLKMFVKGKLAFTFVPFGLKTRRIKSIGSTFISTRLWGCGSARVRGVTPSVTLGGGRNYHPALVTCLTLTRPMMWPRELWLTRNYLIKCHHLCTCMSAHCHLHKR